MVGEASPSFPYTSFSHMGGPRAVVGRNRYRRTFRIVPGAFRVIDLPVILQYWCHKCTHHGAKKVCGRATLQESLTKPFFQAVAETASGRSIGFRWRGTVVHGPGTQRNLFQGAMTQGRLYQGGECMVTSDK